MNTNSAYDQRQYNRMLDLLEAYERKHISLGTLIGNLEALLESLERVSANWPNSFLREWGVLEEIYAVALDQGATRLEDQDLQLIGDTTAKLKNLVRLKLKEGET